MRGHGSSVFGHAVIARGRPTPYFIWVAVVGGKNFEIPMPSPSRGGSFNYTMDIPGGTQFLLLAGDSRGLVDRQTNPLHLVKAPETGGSDECLQSHVGGNSSSGPTTASNVSPNETQP